MKITFLGATRTVTGSCYLLEVSGHKFLVDCGMFQGSKLIKALNEKDFLFHPGEIEAVVLTHAHVDHSGLLPKLVKEGFRGPIYCTKSTEELCSILLPDSAHIQEGEAEYANRKGMRAGKKIVEPLFTVDDAARALHLFKLRSFGEAFNVVPGVTVTFRVAGHILGSAFVEMSVNEGDKKTRLIFTGDIGQPNQPIIEDPAAAGGADFIITESTYGNRIHEAYDKEGELANIINDTVERGGNVIIPAFAVGRTQVLLYYFQKLQAEGKIPEIPIYVDSPMANRATQITMTNPEEYDEEARALYAMQGRRLIEGIKRIKIMGEDIRVNAKIYNMKGFSAHADKQQLLAWYSSMKEVPKAFFVTHGELDAAMELADSLGRNLGTATYIPHFGDCAEIHGTEWQMHESEMVQVEPAAIDLRAYMRGMEHDYLLQRSKIEQIVARNPDKAVMVRKKLEKLHKYMDDILKDL